MRRLLSILLVALFGLAPAAALLPGSDEAQLPACCRRHGAHHCMMSAAAARQASDGTHQISAPAHCPRYGEPAPATRAAIAVSERAPLAHAWQRLMVTEAARRAHMQQARTTADRGPPFHGAIS